MTPKFDYTEGRIGEWMQTDSGIRFHPRDVRRQDININDIANGLASTRRYGGQGRIDRRLCVAEHCILLANYARFQLSWPPAVAMALLLHDAAEAYCGDLTRAMKRSVGTGYSDIENRILDLIMDKYRVSECWVKYRPEIANLDFRITHDEKKAVMRYPDMHEWDVEQSAPLGVKIRHYDAMEARDIYLMTYDRLCREDPHILHEEIVFLNEGDTL